MALRQDYIEKNENSDFCRPMRGAKIIKVEVYKQQKKLKVFLSLPQAIKRKELDNWAEEIGRYFDSLADIELIPVPENTTHIIENILQQRKGDLSSSLFSKDEDKKTFAQQCQINISANRLDLETKDYKYYSHIIEQEICPRIARWFWQEYCLNIIVRVICQKPKKNNVSSVWIKEREIDKLENNSYEVKEKKNYNQRRNKHWEQAINKPPTPLQNLEEGQRNVIIEGEIFAKDINVLKDGRLSVNYFLTDYSDSVNVKVFFEKREEDQIEIGDWIKVKGSVRYDTYARDLVVFMEAFSRGERVERNDLSVEKRIELHCHTNMSALDGITDVKQLIKKAVKWGHKAIAITDHGSVQAFPLAFAAANQQDIKVIYGVEGYLINNDKKEKPYHIIILAQNRAGLKNLYKLVSLSYVDYFYRKPKIPRAEIIKYREGLIIGTACEAGELYQALLKGEDANKIEAIIDFYDYLEIQPLANNNFLIRNKTLNDQNELEQINSQIVALGKKYNKLVAATGDVHFLEPYQESFRTIIQAGQGYKDIEENAPLYFKTTEEMLEEFAYLGERDAHWVVIDCPNQIANSIEKLQPVPDGFYPPKIDTAEQEIVELTWGRAFEIYGNPLPEIVKARIDKELGAIIKHGFSVLYLIAHKLVKKSNEDGYLVGSRGSVGSSIVAYFTGITEVNALAPHYICPNCKYSLFITDGSVGSGVDLEDKDCPHCGHHLMKDGFNIPFETFLGFEGDKVPDIDLNFSGDYQAHAHHYVETLFGRENVFKAGTISTVAEKTAFGFVKKYCEEKQLNLRNAEMKRLAAGITGVRRTTGQHPGGMIVVPHDRDILEFTPLQHPANKKDSGVITTHFEYHAIGDQLVKLDILGHDDPTVIKALEDITGINASEIKLDEKQTMGLFSGVESLKVDAEAINTTVGTYGIPEFGTSFVRQMLETTRPHKFSELVRISGLSHGTDVWLNNAQNLILKETANLEEVICTRDDIMTYLILKGLDNKAAFKIMEKVRKGKGLLDEDIENMQKYNVPDWYIDSCQKIKYMFPKAHAVAYVTMAFRIAWFKVHYPLAFYASFFSIRAEDFDADTILGGYEPVRTRINEINNMGYAASQKDKKLLPILELAMEMYARGFNFYPVDIYKSDAVKFKILSGGLLLPFSSLPNVGVTAAQGIVAARAEAEFVSVEDFQYRSKLNKTAMEILRKENCFNDLPESTQINLFV